MKGTGEYQPRKGQLWGLPPRAVTWGLFSRAQFSRQRCGTARVNCGSAGKPVQTCVSKVSPENLSVTQAQVSGNRPRLPPEQNGYIIRINFSGQTDKELRLKNWGTQNLFSGGVFQRLRGCSHETGQGTFPKSGLSLE